MYRFNIISIKTPKGFFTETEETILNSAVASLKTLHRQRDPDKKNKVRGITLPTFKPHYKATIIKTIHYGPKRRHAEQQNETEPAIKLWQTRSTNSAREPRTPNGERTVSSTNGAGETCRTTRVGPSCTTHKN